MKFQRLNELMQPNLNIIDR